MIVLDELAVVDEILAEIQDLLDAVSDLEGVLGVVDPADIAVGQFDRRPLDGVDGDDAGGLAGSFGLDLGPRREEVVDQVHRGGVDAGGREAVVACATVA